MSKHLHDERAGAPDINRDERFDVLDAWISRGLGDVPQPIIERYKGRVPPEVIARCRMGLAPRMRGKRIRDAALNSRYCRAYYETHAEALRAKKREQYARRKKAAERRAA